MNGHSRSIILKNEDNLCRSAADDTRFLVKVCTLCRGEADKLCFSVKVCNICRGVADKLRFSMKVSSTLAVETVSLLQNFN